MTVTVKPIVDVGRRRLFRAEEDSTWSMLWKIAQLPKGEHVLALESKIATGLHDEKTKIRIDSFSEGDGGIANSIRLKKGNKYPLVSHGVEFEGE